MWGCWAGCFNRRMFRNMNEHQNQADRGREEPIPDDEPLRKQQVPPLHETEPRGVADKGVSHNTK
jgi:hypothetical protein